jgi:hypothetical protein
MQQSMLIGAAGCQARDVLTKQYNSPPVLAQQSGDARARSAPGTNLRCICRAYPYGRNKALSHFHTTRCGLPSRVWPGVFLLLGGRAFGSLDTKMLHAQQEDLLKGVHNGL